MGAYSIYTDQELVALLSAGNEGAFTEIYNRYVPKILYQMNTESIIGFKPPYILAR